MRKEDIIEAPKALSFVGAIAITGGLILCL